MKKNKKKIKKLKNPDNNVGGDELKIEVSIPSSEVDIKLSLNMKEGDKNEEKIIKFISILADKFNEKYPPITRTIRQVFKENKDFWEKKEK